MFAVKDFASYSNYLNRNYLTPLNTYVEASSLDLEPYGSALEYVKHNGQLMGLPYRSDIYVLYFNRDMFDKAGIPYPSNEMTCEMTWQEFQETAKLLTSSQAAYAFAKIQFPERKTLFLIYVMTMAVPYRRPGHACKDRPNSGSLCRAKRPTTTHPVDEELDQRVWEHLSTYQAKQSIRR